MNFYIEVNTKLGRNIRTSKRHWEHIIGKHESIIGLEEPVKKVLIDPTYIKLSKEDNSVYLYYGRYGKYYLCVVCRHLNGEGFIITAYQTEIIKKGVTIFEAYKDNI